jgi:hypothetical protein
LQWVIRHTLFGGLLSGATVVVVTKHPMVIQAAQLVIGLEHGRAAFCGSPQGYAHWKALQVNIPSASGADGCAGQCCMLVLARSPCQQGHEFMRCILVAFFWLLAWLHACVQVKCFTGEDGCSPLSAVFAAAIAAAVAAAAAAADAAAAAAAAGLPAVSGCCCAANATLLDAPRQVCSKFMHLCTTSY